MARSASPARLGLGSYAFRWSIGIGERRPPVPMSAAEVLEAAAALGFELVQYADNLPLHELPEAELETLGERAAALGLVLEIGQQGADMELLARYLDIASRLGASLVRLALDAADAAEGQDALRRAFDRAAESAAARGVTLAIENHFGFPSERLASLITSVDSEHLGVCLDVANSICAGEWPEETIGRLAPYTVNLHLKDYDIVPDPHGVGFRVLGTPLGEGRLDIGEVIATLEGARRDYNVVLEHWLPGDDGLDALAAREREWIARSASVARERLGRS